MNREYQKFYPIDDNFVESASEQLQDFQLSQYAPKIKNGMETKGPKTVENGIILTQNTVSNHTKSNNLEQCQRKKKTWSTQIQLPKQNEIQKWVKPKNQINIYNTIEPTLFMLRKIEACKIGKRQQTMNLNKYYCCCLKDYLRSLNVCKILDLTEYNHYQQVLKNNQIDLFQPSESVSKLLETYINSSSIVNKILLSNKMDFQNKIVALKYLQILKQKVLHVSKGERGWKKKIT